MLNDLVLVTSMSGVITCYNAKNGNTLWIDRLREHSLVHLLLAMIITTFKANLERLMSLSQTKKT